MFVNDLMQKQTVFNSNWQWRAKRCEESQTEWI